MIIPSTPPISVSVPNTGGTINGSPLTLGNSMQADVPRQAAIGNIPTSVVPMAFEKSRTENQNQSNQNHTPNQKPNGQNATPQSPQFLAQAFARDSSYYTPQLASDLNRFYQNTKDKDQQYNTSSPSQSRDAKGNEASKPSPSLSQIFLNERQKDKEKAPPHMLKQKVDKAIQAYDYTSTNVASNIV